jgi:hypothetical protein|tara:strand:- start:465 stop:683 length:219 start_codon:yes stop_codon:yes gene_type:complete
MFADEKKSGPNLLKRAVKSLFFSKVPPDDSIFIFPFPIGWIADSQARPSKIQMLSDFRFQQGWIAASLRSSQ